MRRRGMTAHYWDHPPDKLVVHSQISLSKRKSFTQREDFEGPETLFSLRETTKCQRKICTNISLCWLKDLKIQLKKGYVVCRVLV